MIVKLNNELSYGKLKLLSEIVRDFAELEETNIENGYEYPSGKKYDYDEIQRLRYRIGELMDMRQQDVKKWEDIAQSKPGHYLVTYIPFDGIKEQYECSTDEDLRTIPHLVK